MRADRRVSLSSIPKTTALVFAALMVAFLFAAVALRETAADDPTKKADPVADAKSPDAAVAVVLARNCLECHNASDRKGGLDLTRRERSLAGGDSGAALKP